MLAFIRTKLCTKYVAIAVGIIALLSYLFFSYTSAGRLLGLYMVGGIQAPWHTRSECRDESRARVAEKFSQPLSMDEAGRTGLAEYWHYSFYRNCLYNAGYSFLGKPLPHATLLSGATDVRYTNPLAGATLSLPSGTTQELDNVLDVNFDYRLLRSSFLVGTSTIVFDTYTTHEYIHSLADVPMYLDHLPTTGGSIFESKERTNLLGTPYLWVEQNDGYCGGIVVTPVEKILHLYAPCSERKLINQILDSLTITDNAVSIY